MQGLGLLPPQVDGSREGAAVRAQGRRRDADCRVWGGCREGPGQEHLPCQSPACSPRLPSRHMASCGSRAVRWAVGAAHRHQPLGLGAGGPSTVV